MNRYYKILGLPPNASKAEIKRAYRKMAMRHHPDKNPNDPAAADKFRQILEAYEFLTGMRKRTATHQLSAEELRKIRDLMKKAAEEKAKAKFRERVREFRRAQEIEQGREYARGIFALAGILVIAFAVWRGFVFYKNLMIESNPVVAEAQISGFATKRIIYKIKVGKQRREYQKYLGFDGLDPISKSGMPLKVGDRFEVIYSGHNPDLHRVDFKKVHPETMRRYLKITSQKLQAIFYEDWKTLDQSEKNRRSVCLAMRIFEKEHFDGLATVLFSEVSFWDNFSHNKGEWERMKGEGWFAEAWAGCAELD